VNNPGLKALELFPKTLSPLALLPYPPGLPSLAAYKTAVVSPTFKAMERWNSAWAKANSESLAEYTLHKDPLHAWSRKYEYVWAAEVARAAVEASPSHKDLSTKLEATWPSSPVQQGVGNGASSEAFKVMDLGSGFTFFPQYLASRLGVEVTALDHSGDLKAFYGAQPLSPMDGEEGGTIVSFITGSMDAMSDVPSGSFDYILCVGTLDTISDVGLTVREVHRVLKRGGRFAFTFNSGQDGIAQSPKAAAKLLDVVRGVMTEDVTHGAPSELLGGGAARFLFTNHKARPPEFLEKTFSVSCHVFIKV
jgi:SAM-dependent methyltransferase